MTFWNCGRREEVRRFALGVLDSEIRRSPLLYVSSPVTANILTSDSRPDAVEPMKFSGSTVGRPVTLACLRRGGVDRLTLPPVCLCRSFSGPPQAASPQSKTDGWRLHSRTTTAFIAGQTSWSLLGHKTRRDGPKTTSKTNPSTP